MDDLRFYVLFNSVSVISGQWKVDNERLCNGALFMIEKISPQVGIELSPLDQWSALNPLSYLGTDMTASLLMHNIFHNPIICI